MPLVYDQEIFNRIRSGSCIVPAYTGSRIELVYQDGKLACDKDLDLPKKIHPAITCVGGIVPEGSDTFIAMSLLFNKKEYSWKDTDDNEFLITETFLKEQGFHYPRYFLYENDQPEEVNTWRKLSQYPTHGIIVNMLVEGLRAR